MSTQLTDETETLRFRGPTIEAALDAAQSSLGGKVQLLGANRLRRGGIGGFFASDMGVEVSVSLEHESIEEALQRMVDSTAADEREDWRRLVAASAPITDVAPITPPSFESVAATVDNVILAAAGEPEPEYLEFHTIAIPTFAASPATIPEIAPASIEAPSPSHDLVPTELSIPAINEPAQPKPSPAMLRRHVELAVAAADQLIEGLTHTPNVKSISARVVVRSGNQYDVEMDVRWESQGEPTS
jgi:hypothetical protein